MKQEEVVLAGMLSSKFEHQEKMQNVGRAITSLDVEAFHEICGIVFRVVRRFFIEQGGIIDREILADVLVKKKIPAVATSESLKLYDECVGSSVTKEKFVYAIREVRSEWVKSKFMEILVDGMQALTEEGYKEGKLTFKGYDEARVLINQKLSDLDKQSGESKAVDIRISSDETRALDSVKSGGKQKRILTGMKTFDTVIGGSTHGEFELVVGYSNEGKSMLTTNFIWHRVAMQKLNALVFVGEMALAQYRRRILCRHSHLKMFGCEGGVNYTKAARGELQGKDLKVYTDAVQDWETNKDYGRCILAPIPRGRGVDYIHALSNQYKSLFPIDLIVVDRVELVAANRRRQTEREELGEVIRDLRHLALDFDGGKGVLLQAVGQTNRESWKTAKKQGFYTLSAQAESAEFEKSPDILMWVLLPEEEGANKLVVGISKNRDGKRLKAGNLFEDFTTSYIGDPKKRSKEAL